MVPDMTNRDLTPIDVTIPGSPDDPRDETPAPEGVRIHRVPPLHPEEVVTLPSGLRVTSVARTLIDLAEELTRDARVEWRPSLAMLDSVIAEFEG
jgi:hypothetical protein